MEMFKGKTLRRIFGGGKRETGLWRTSHDEENYEFYTSEYIIKVFISGIRDEWYM